MLRHLTILLGLLLLACCTHGPKSDPRLMRAGSLAADSPREALALLDSVCPDSLSKADRFRYDFLTVKASDKAFVTHTSDSLILGVIAYAESHPSAIPYAEALYYGGRVYSDLGDYPTSLSYFQQALDALPDNKENLRLRAVILSQTGRLMRRLGLDIESIPLIEETLEIRRQIGDKRGELYSLLALGYVYYNIERYSEAEFQFKNALRISSSLSPADRANVKVWIAETKYAKEEIDSAIYYIQNNLDSIKSESHNSSLATMAKVYLKAGITDSAYFYAHKLITSPSDLNRHIGYKVILSPELRQYSPIDTLVGYTSAFNDFLWKKFLNNNSEKFVSQYNQYDYRKHKRDRDAAIEKLEKLQLENRWLYIILFIIVGANLGYVLYLYRQKWMNRTVRELQTVITNENDDARTALINKVLSRTDDATLDAVLDDMIDTDARKSLHRLIKNDSNLTDNSPLWQEMEKVISDKSPTFFLNLDLLSSYRLTELEKKMAILMRMGISHADLPVLIARTRGAVTSRKNTLSTRLLNQTLSFQQLRRVLIQL